MFIRDIMPWSYPYRAMAVELKRTTSWVLDRLNDDILAVVLPAARSVDLVWWFFLQVTDRN